MEQIEPKEKTTREKIEELIEEVSQGSIEGESESGPLRAELLRKAFFEGHSFLGFSPEVRRRAKELQDALEKEESN